MVLEYYAIKDTKVGFMNPFLQHNQMEAIRNFRTALRDERSEMALNPADYELWFIGQWDDLTGFIQCNGPKFIENGVEGKKNAERNTENLQQI